MNDRYNDILLVISSALTSNDEVEVELLNDMAEAAYNYTGYRLRDNFYTREKKNEEDAARTASHNRFMDTLNIFLRYEKSLGKDVPDLSDLDRKALGDIGNKIVCDLSIRQR